MWRARCTSPRALRARYMATLRDIAEKHLDWAVQGPRIKQWQALIAEDVKADTRKLYSSGFESDVASLQAFLTRRRATLLR